MDLLHDIVTQSAQFTLRFTLGVVQSVASDTRLTTCLRPLGVMRSVLTAVTIFGAPHIHPHAHDPWAALISLSSPSSCLFQTVMELESHRVSLRV